MKHRPRTKRAEREMQAEAESKAVILDEDREEGPYQGPHADEVAALPHVRWLNELREIELRNMKQDSLPLKDQPIRGADLATKGESVASTNVHDVMNDLLVPTAFTDARAVSLRKPFEVRAAEIQDKVKALTDKRAKASGVISAFLVAEAQELNDESDKLLKEIQDSDLRKEGDVFFKYHRAITSAISFVSAAPVAAKKLFSDFAFSRKQQLERAERVAKEQREAIQRAADEKARADRVAALQAENRVEEAQIVKETPLPPPMAPAAKETAAIAPGVSARGIPKLVRIKDCEKFVNKVLVRDPSRLAELFDAKEGKFTSWLTSHMDKKTYEFTIDLEEFGIEVEITGSSRSRKSNGDV